MEEQEALVNLSNEAKVFYSSLKDLIRMRANGGATYREVCAMAGLASDYQEVVELERAGLIITRGMRACSVSGRMMTLFVPAETIRAKPKRPARTFYIGMNQHGNVERVYFDKPLTSRHFELVEVSEKSEFYPIDDDPKDAQTNHDKDRAVQPLEVGVPMARVKKRGRKPLNS